MSAYAQENDIDAFVSDGGGGDKITVMMMPDQRRWQFANITPETARQLAQRLTIAANDAEKNTPAH
ncbi:hypothetical protein D3227_04740 [Mesorhizobium waimense]|uniref:Uncharacterized protein n=1 Tax=Mesorhizobium waimense TaxID=1300307 RepID=A0A3A5L1G9_9HYPH|nr:hypothetical protein [Mesorhizobium waimense]RJT41989.1 hypothetical protein D3227_04740 [Mesorhizobium waimense]